MGKKKQATKDPYLLKKEELRRQEEIETKVARTGMTHSICKACGSQPIGNFYVQRITKNGKSRWRPKPHCKECEKVLIPSLGKKKRDIYRETNKKKMKVRYKSNRDELAAASRKSQQEARDNLSESYVRKLIHRETGIEKGYITDEMIEEKRKDILARRKRIKTKTTHGAHNKRWRKKWLRNEISGLGRSYIKKLMRLSGFKGEITEGMIQERREQVLADREKRGKCGTEVQQLSASYVTRLIARSEGISPSKVTDTMILERMAQILDKRKRWGTKLKDKKKKGQTSSTPLP